MCPQVTFSVWISEPFFSRAKHTPFHFHWQLQTEATFWNTGIHLKFHFHFSEIIQMSSVYTEPSQQSELFSILLWRGSWFWLFTHFGTIKSPRLRLGLFIAPKCVKSQNQLPFHTIKTCRFGTDLRMLMRSELQWAVLCCHIDRWNTSICNWHVFSAVM